MPLSRSDQARVNGAKSHGPITPEGKARSSLNALKHGRYATNAIVLSNEDADALEELVANYVCRIQPTDPVEYGLTRELASLDWRLTRVFALDTRMLDREMDIQLPALAIAGLSLSELTRLLDASRSIVDRSKLPAYLARREAQLINARRSILAVLKDLRKNFPSSDPAPEVVLPQPLDPDSPQQNEPETNPTESRPKRVSAVSEEAPQVCAPPLGPAPELTSPQPASLLSINSGVEACRADPQVCGRPPGRPLPLPGTADPQVCAPGPYGPGSKDEAPAPAPEPTNPKVVLGSDSTSLEHFGAEPSDPASESRADPQVCAGPPGPAPELTSPQPANILPIDSAVELGEHAPNLNSDNSVPGTASEEAALGSSSASIQQTGAEPVGPGLPRTTADRPGGRPPHPGTPRGSAPPLPKAA